MLTISQALAPYHINQGDTPRKVWRKNNRFRLLLHSLDTQMGSSWALVMWMTYRGMRHTTPDELMRVWHDWGLDTVDQLTLFISAFDSINAGELIDDIDLMVKIDLSRRQKVRGTTFANLLREECYVSPSCKYHYTDKYYYLFKQEDIDALLQASRIPSLKHKYSESFDCDDAARMFKAWLSYMGIGNMALAYVEVAQYGPQHKRLSTHALNLYILDDNSVMLLEPHRSFSFDPKTPEIGFGSLEQQELIFVEF